MAWCGVGALIDCIARVQGAEPLHYQWQKGGTPLQCDTADDRVLLLPNARRSDRGSYSCCVRNGGGATTSRFHTGQLAIPVALCINSSSRGFWTLVVDMSVISFAC